MTGVNKPTILKLLADLGTACAEYHDRTVRDIVCKRIQCDEVWSYVGAKQKNVPEEKKGERLRQDSQDASGLLRRSVGLLDAAEKKRRDNELLSNGDRTLLLEAFWRDSDDRLTLTAFRPDLPFALVEKFVSEVRPRLTPIDRSQT